MRRLIGLALIFGVAVLSCTSDRTEVSSTTSSVEAPPPVGSTTSRVPASATPIAPATTAGVVDSTVPGAGARSVECLVGEWELDSPLFFDQLGSVFPDEFPNVKVEHAGGAYRIALGADGSFVGIRDGWSLAIGTGEGRLVQTIDDEDTGVYRVDEGAGSISVTFEPSAGPIVITQIQVDGVLEPLDADPSALELPGAAGDPSGSFSCSESRLVVTTSLGLVSEFFRR